VISPCRLASAGSRHSSALRLFAMRRGAIMTVKL
jgi:hypothetical protein